MELGKEYFGPLWSFVASNEITDIDYNGKEIWLTNIFNERFRANQQFVTQYMTPAFVEQFTQRIANVVSRQFNKRNPELEAETSELRVTILHESVAKSGRSISIRKTPPLIRLTAESAIAEKFCSEELLAVLINCVKTKMNITFCGMPGIGKTECVKFFSQFIPANERVITIEDTLEIRYAETNPGKDCIEMKVSEDVFGYSEAIKSCLRMNPKWIMLSEGYKMSVKNSSGNVIQTIYYQMGGSYMTLKCQAKSSGKEYMMYKIPLRYVRNRMNQESLDALSSGSCTIILDACMVLRVNGKNRGGMNDNGPSWGKVYTTYAGISKAANWTDSALSALYSYYGKTVRGLFHTIDVRKSTGISSVSGGGTYCYGTYVTISASSSAGYDFTNWNNDSSMSLSSYGFYVNSGGTYTAYAKAGTIAVTFWRNTSASDSEKTSKSYTYGGINQAFPAVGWQMAGYHMNGWGNNSYDTTAVYPLLCGVANSWIESNRPSKNIYAVWQENEYTIEYDTGVSATVKYSDTVTLPSQHMCIGWILGEEYPDIKYAPGESIQVADLCRILGIEYTDKAVIRMYALWEHEPTIEADDMFFSIKQARNGGITEQLIGSLISATDVEDGDIAFGDNEINYLKVKNFDDRKIESARDKDIIEIVLEAKDSYGNITQKTISITFADTQVKERTKAFGKIRFISEKYYGKNKAGGLMENSRWLNDPEFNSLLREALAI